MVFLDGCASYRQRILHGLSSNAPPIRLLKALEWSYILVAKASAHTYMFELVKQNMKNAHGSRLETPEEEGTKRIYHYVNNIPLNASNTDLLVHFLEYWEFKDGKEIYHNSWVTEIELHQNHVDDVMTGGRARWKIENETVNTLKNQGYNLEHHYGHGKQHLATVLATLMMLQLLIAQVPEVAGALFKAARGRCHSRVQWWDLVRSRFLEHLLPSGEIWWKSIIYGFKPKVIQLDTS